MLHRTRPRSTLAILAATITVCSGLTRTPVFAQPARPAAPGPVTSPINMDSGVTQVQHRAMLALLGTRLPDDALDGLTWLEGGPVSLAEERGKAVLIQFWDMQSVSSRSWQQRVAASQLRFGADDLTVIAVHTPGDIEPARVFVSRQQMTVATAIDSTGRLTRLVRADLHPFNIIIDRQGAIRAWGFNGRGIDAAIDAAVRQPFDPDAPLPPIATDTPDPADADAPAGPVGDTGADRDDGYPPYSNPVITAADIRGLPAPPLQVQTWLSEEPDLRGKVLIVDFWATWCGPCIASIPHTNDLANRFRDEVVVVGLSREDIGTVRQFLRRGKPAIDYPVAVDPMGRTQTGVNVRGIPHMMVVSPDGVVRFQGMPTELTPELLARIIEASRPAN